MADGEFGRSLAGIARALAYATLLTFINSYVVPFLTKRAAKADESVTRVAEPKDLQVSSSTDVVA
jgi:hypothetical protein